MPSSTSSSRRFTRAGNGLAIALFAAAFTALAVAGETLARTTPTLQYAHPGPSREQRPAGHWYIDHGLGVNSFSHRVLYHGLGSSIDNARAAELVVLGSSKVLCGLPYDTLDAFAAEHDLRYFNLGLGFGESNVLPEAIIRKFDLRPKLFVANADWFFTDQPSSYGATILTDGWVEDSRERVEARGAFFYRERLQSFLPHFLPTIPIPIRRWDEERVSAFLRSADTGSWLPWNALDRGLPVDAAARGPALPPWQTPIARRMKEFLESRGSALVLTHVPSPFPTCSRASARALAEEIGVPFVAPELEGLVAMDDLHLNDVGAHRFAEAFLAELESTPVFRELFP